MKTPKSTIIVLFVLLAAQIASAYYCPATGCWLSRDPIGELGFETLRTANALPQVGSSTPTPSRWISRTEKGKRKIESGRNEINAYAFAQNAPPTFIDALGLSIADVANMYKKFLDTFDDWCKSKKCCPEVGWMQNFPGTPYWGCKNQSENLQGAFDTLTFEDGWDIQNHYEDGILFHHNSVDVIPHNPDDPVVHADTWKGCFSATWPAGSSQANFSKCWSCKDRVKSP
jgi:hypothetical protein